MYRSLLVPLDGSPFAEQALPFALSIARHADAALHVVMVGPQVNESQNDYLQKVVDRVRREDRTSTVSVDGQFLQSEDVAPTICAQALRDEVNLVVMSTHGRGMLGRLFLGSVGHEVMAHLPVPVLLIPPQNESARWEMESVLKHILVILDGSPEAEQILEPAISLGQLMDADYMLLRVISNIPRDTPELDSISLSSRAPQLVDEIRDIFERERKCAQYYLDGIAGQLRLHGLRVQCRVACADELETGILDESMSPDIDAITVENDQFHGTIPNELVWKVLRLTNKPVLVQSTAEMLSRTL